MGTDLFPLPMSLALALGMKEIDHFLKDLDTIFPSQEQGAAWERRGQGSRMSFREVLD